MKFFVVQVNLHNRKKVEDKWNTTRMPFPIRLDHVHSLKGWGFIKVKGGEKKKRKRGSF